MTSTSPVDTVHGMDAIVIAAPTLSPYLRTMLPDGRSPVEHLAARVEMITNQKPAHVLVLTVERESTLRETAPDVASQWNVVTVQSSGSAAPRGADALRSAREALPAECETVAWIAIDAPFIDPALYQYLYALHARSWSDYTFGDGFPVGFGAEFVRVETLPAVESLAASRNLSWNRSLLFDALSIDINAFDIETEAASEDFAALRLSLTVDVLQNVLLCRALVERGVAIATPIASDVPDPYTTRFDDRTPLLNVLRDDRTIGRTRPYWYQVQITEELPQQPYWTPWADARWAPPEAGARALSLDQWRALVERIARFTPEATIAIGYRGEPARHPQIAELIAAVSAWPGITLYVETCGIGWTEEGMAALSLPHVGATIVEIDAVNDDQYAKLRGAGFQEAVALVTQLATRAPGRVYAQATRMQENEWELQEFYQYWNAVPGVTPIIQKYNDFAGRLPARRVADLAPYKRQACWHLTRDLVVRVDGTVVRCFQDLDGEYVRGNILTDNIEEVWQRAEPDFRDHVAGTFGGICEHCDEHYTFYG